MTVDSKIITGTYSPNGEALLEQFTPNAGEVWLVDIARISSDGGGSSTGIGYTLSVYDANVSVTATNFHNGAPSNSAQMDGSITNANTISIGGYITEGDTLYFGQTDTTNDGSTMHYAIILRRWI